jgi:hypothetical protein
VALAERNEKRPDDRKRHPRESQQTQWHHRLGLGMAHWGFYLVLGACLVALRDAVHWLLEGEWSDTSLRALLGALPRHQWSHWEALKVGLWVQPVWLLMVVAGAFLALAGSVLMKDR